jgi:hypothetical protein
MWNARSLEVSIKQDDVHMFEHQVYQKQKDFEHILFNKIALRPDSAMLVLDYPPSRESYNLICLYAEREKTSNPL